MNNEKMWVENFFLCVCDEIKNYQEQYYVPRTEVDKKGLETLSGPM